DRLTVVDRLRGMLAEGASQGCDLVVFPELALTTFFPRWYLDDITDADHFYETSMPNDATQPLFDEARDLEIGFCLGYALLETAADGPRHPWEVPAPAARRGQSLDGQYLVGAHRLERRHVQEGAHPRPRVQRARPAVPASRAVLLRA